MAALRFDNYEFCWIATRLQIKRPVQPPGKKKNKSEYRYAFCRLGVNTGAWKKIIPSVPCEFMLRIDCADCHLRTHHHHPSSTWVFGCCGTTSVTLVCVIQIKAGPGNRGMVSSVHCFERDAKSCTRVTCHGDSYCIKSMSHVQKTHRQSHFFVMFLRS